MPADRLSDAEGKLILRGWPGRTKIWSDPGSRAYWLRALPKEPTGVATCPRLQAPGTETFHTQPDGMWLLLPNGNWADVVVVEICGTFQNLNDKRARYFPSGCAIMVTCPVNWLLENMPLPNSQGQPRWKAARSLQDKPTYDSVLPVRYLKVLFSLPNVLYNEWRNSGIPAAHEYYCQHSSLGTFSSVPTQTFLKRMSMATHFLTG